MSNPATPWPAWLTQLQAASFRGVVFKFGSSARQNGRRVVIHEYPDVDQPDTEDLGRKPRTQTIEAWVIGSNYMAERDALEAALDMAGPGDLIHPYKGKMSVVITDWTVTEQIDQGGMARFSISYVQAAAVTQPAAAAATQAAVLNQVGTVQACQAAFLPSVYNAAQPGDAAEALRQLGSLLAPNGSLPASALPLFTAPQQLPLTTLTAQIQADIENPAGLYSIIQNVIDGIPTLAALTPFFTASTTAPASSTQSQANLAAFETAVQVEAVITACGLSANTTFDSYNDAIAEQDTLLDAIDAVSANVDMPTYAALQDLRATVAADIAARAANLAIITSVTLPEFLPALVLAQHLYGAADCVEASADILARNAGAAAVLHPAFLPSGVPLEVLSEWDS